jgi:hypothetical protein
MLPVIFEGDITSPSLLPEFQSAVDPDAGAPWKENNVPPAFSGLKLLE